MSASVQDNLHNHLIDWQACTCALVSDVKWHCSLQRTVRAASLSKRTIWNRIDPMAVERTGELNKCEKMLSYKILVVVDLCRANRPAEKVARRRLNQ